MAHFATSQELELHRAGLVDPNKDKFIDIYVGTSTCGLASGAGEVLVALDKEITARGLQTKIRVHRTGCIGQCHAEPIVEVEIPGRDRLTFGHFNDARSAELIEDLAKQCECRHSPVVGMGIYTKQVRIVLRNCGRIDPESIDSYFRVNGYRQLALTITQRKPQDIIDMITASGLRGRGGGGFPTGQKWGFCAKAAGSPKYVVCNADEGDPGAFMDRSVLEGDPHSIVEAMAIAGYAIGATEGVIYCRAEYPLAIRNLRIALDQARACGLLGKNILGSTFSFDISIKLGAGAFVCGEETALLRSIEGRRGEPTNKPPFPANCGLWQKPTVINNVETFASIVPILEKGVEWFRSIGTKESPGTKVFALAGDIKNVGLVEVPMGTTLREVIYDMGGGSTSGRPVKAVQTGGPSGGCITAEKFDTPIDYSTLMGLGSMMGSGGMIVMDEGTSMVGIARFYLQFTQEESCGKCVPCRLGTKRMLQILDGILAGKGCLDDLKELDTLGQSIKAASLCGLGQTAPNPVLSTIRWFRNEYEDMILKGKPVTRYSIDPALCIGCTKCARVCPVRAIMGAVKKPHVIDQATCISCGACEGACPVKPVKAVSHKQEFVKPQNQAKAQAKAQACGCASACK